MSDLGGNYKLRKRDGEWERRIGRRWVKLVSRVIETPRAKRLDGKKDYEPVFSTDTSWDTP